jgi:hypothetical protein
MYDVRCKKYEKVPIYYIVGSGIAQRSGEETQAVGHLAYQ